MRRAPPPDRQTGLRRISRTFSACAAVAPRESGRQNGGVDQHEGVCVWVLIPSALRHARRTLFLDNARCGSIDPKIMRIINL
jgi:hypothetical protein